MPWTPGGPSSIGRPKAWTSPACFTGRKRPLPASRSDCAEEQDHGLELALDHQLIELAGPALDDGRAVEIDLPIRNSNRTVAAMLSGKVAKAYGEDGLPEDTIKVKFNGSAGQSFGAFLANGNQHRSGRRHERLHGQRDVRRQDSGLSGPQSRLRPRGKYHHRQRRPVRGPLAGGPSSTASPASASASATAASKRW